jgi:uncharacterized membrane protein HdeD (DUF308 family)
MSLDRRVARSLREQWGLFLAEGVVLLVLGLAAIVLPPIALALALFLGWLLVIIGLVGLFTTVSMRRAPGFWPSLVSALAAIVAGFLLTGWPVKVASALPLVLGIFFAVEGIASIVFALAHKRAMSGRWSSMAASGIVDLALSGIILADLPGIAPGTAGWVIGLLVGISMVFGGVSLIAMALDARAIRP